MFRHPHLAGYIFHSEIKEPIFVSGYYIASHRMRYDFQDKQNGRGLVTVKRDPMGGDTFIEYDIYQLMAIKETDPAGLST